MQMKKERKVYVRKRGTPAFRVEKVRMQIHLSKETDKEFRQFLAQKYQTVEQGMLSFEVEQALQAWVAEYKLKSMREQSGD